MFTYNGWKRLIEDQDEHGKCGVKFITNIKMKAKYLYHALAILLDKKETDPSLSWQSICGLAVDKVKDFEGANLIENDSCESTYHWVRSRTAMCWFCNFRDNKECFVNVPHQQSLIDKHPDLKIKFTSFAKANVQGLTGEVLLDYLHNTIIPELIEEEKSETCVELTKKELLRKYRLTKLCLGTVYKWMQHFGFIYSISNKNLLR